MAELGKRSSVAVSWIGKVKTTAQMAAQVSAVASNAQVEWAGIGLLWSCRGADPVVNAAIFERGARGDCLNSDRFAVIFGKRSGDAKNNVDSSRHISRMQRIERRLQLAGR